MTQPHREPSFPFTAIVGQTTMKRALLLNTVNPRIGGVLIRGKKGTAKSTAVRSLAALLPQVTVLQGCPYSCAPEARQGLCQWCESGSNDNIPVSHQVRIVDLPVGASEDRLVGSLDIEQAIKSGTKSFEPGLIAAAHRGILYIDEVNLLNDHLVDVLLDASAMGRNYVEREGISVSHAAEFILVGTMNPEEGDLRPQLLDRFGLAVEVDGIMPAAERREVVRRRMAFESAPFAFMDSWQTEEEQERKRLRQSRDLLPQVTVGDDILGLITDICAEYQVDGLRGDIVMYKTASTIAAYDGRTEVNVEDVREAAQMALLHRQRRQPFQQPHLVTEQLDSMLEEFQNQSRSREPADNSLSQSQDRSEEDSEPSDLSDAESAGDPDSGTGPQDQWFETGNPYAIQPVLLPPADRRERTASGRRTTTVSGSTAGRYVGARIPPGTVSDLALDATLRAAAPHQARRHIAAADQPGDAEHRPALVIEPWDVREKVSETKTGSLILFVVDASGSMGAQRRMVAVKGAILSLLLDAYQRRDKVALITFRGTGANLLLPPTNSVDLAQLHLQEMPTGGRTPLARGLYLALETLETERLKDRSVLPLVLVMSDGRANVALSGEGGQALDEALHYAAIFEEKRLASVVIDTELDFIKLQMAKPLADAMGARYLKLEDLRADNLADAVLRELPGVSGDSLPEGTFPAESAGAMRRLYDSLTSD